MKITQYLILAGIVPANAALLADFDGNGSFTEQAFKSAPIGSVRDGGPTGSYYHLIDGAQGDAGNHLAFPATGTAGWQTATLSMDLRADRVQADGFGVGFVDVATHGNDLVRSGAGGRRGEEERAAYSNSVGVGFRTFNGTNATVNYDGLESGDFDYSLAAGEWVSVEVSMTRNGDGALVSASIGGESVFTDFAVAGAPDDFRIQIAGRTGGSSMDLDIDNVNLTTSQIPEPSGALLAGLGLLALGARRKR